MDGILIFNQSNDLIYKKFNHLMNDKIRELAISHELVEKDSDETQYLHSDVIIQIFSPIIASQRIMFCQFDNSYTSLQCENDFNMVFEEQLGYLFLKIGTKSVELLKRYLGVCISFVKHICGPDMLLLKTLPPRSEMLTNLLNTWLHLYENDQSILVEAVEQLLVNSELRNVAISALQQATEKLKQNPHSQRSHALLFVKNKFLSLYSSRQAQEISSADILFLNIFCQSNSVRKSSEPITQSYLLFLQGNSINSLAGCIPHIVHIIELSNGVKLLLLIEYGSLAVSSGINDIFFALHKTQNLQTQFDMENLKPAFDNLDLHVKQTTDALKKAKYNNSEIEICIKKFTVKWEILRKKYVDVFKVCDKELVVKIESNIPGFIEALKELFKITCFDCNTLDHGIQRVSEITSMVDEKLGEFTEFLQVKALQNFTMGSYLEEFPGLVHFIHLDRSSGRVTSPNLDSLSQEKTLIPKEKVWNMVEMSRTYLQKGHMAMMWKDTAFNYSYFLWFEDTNGTSLKPKELPNTSASNLKPMMQPGIMAGEFYQRFIEICFPKIPSTKIKCFELFCVHLGLTTSSCVLEHCRRLAATINEVTGAPGNPLDLL